jgi:glycosyltransferase involved in cell wall biosynthesis
MSEPVPTSIDAPILSVVIVVLDDWEPLDQCLQSLHRQQDPPAFEVVVVDDGSIRSVPDSIRRWSSEFPLTIVREPHRGIAASRNSGVLASAGEAILFVDADCKLQPDCLARLTSALVHAPENDYFQLHLFGDHSNLVGRAEELRLRTLQAHALQPNGRIRYLNTAGFAIRRKRVRPGKGIFDPESLRAEDTLLLCDLMESGELPLFVPDAVVTHAIPLTLMECFRKDFRSAPLEARSFRVIANRGIPVRMTNRDRLQILTELWTEATNSSLGSLAWFVAVARQGLQRVLSSFYAVFPPKNAR